MFIFIICGVTRFLSSFSDKLFLSVSFVYIWDKYYKNKKKHKRNLIGTGLGLNIVKNILEQHKFKYGVKSSNKGTTFYFEIKKEG